MESARTCDKAVLTFGSAVFGFFICIGQGHCAFLMQSLLLLTRVHDPV